MGLVKIHLYNRETTGKNENRRTRAAGHTPAILYGDGRQATKVQLDTVEFTRIMKKTGGRSVIFDLDLEGEDENPIALVRELQQHPVTDQFTHVDLFEIPRGKPVEVEVSVIAEGESQAVKFNEAAIVQLLDTVTVSCLPREMPDRIVINVAELEINESVYVKDLTSPAGEIMTDPELQLLVVKAVSLFVEEEEIAEDAEGEEGAEGAEGDEGDDAGDKSGD